MCSAFPTTTTTTHPPTACPAALYRRVSPEVFAVPAFSPRCVPGGAWDPLGCVGWGLSRYSTVAQGPWLCLLPQPAPHLLLPNTPPSPMMKLSSWQPGIPVPSQRFSVWRKDFLKSLPVSFWLLSGHTSLSLGLSKSGFSLFSEPTFCKCSLLPAPLFSFLPVLGVPGLAGLVSQRREGPKAEGAFVGVGGIPALLRCFAGCLEG